MEKGKNKFKKFLLIGGGAVTLAGVGILTWVFGHTPVEGKHNWRSTHRKDGVPKKAFDSPSEANLQSLIQLLKYGEKCNSYREGDKYYTGHRYNS